MKAKSYYGRLSLLASIKYIAAVAIMLITYLAVITDVFFQTGLLNKAFQSILVILSLAIFSPLFFFFFQGKGYCSALEFSPQVKKFFSRNLVFLCELIFNVLLVLIFFFIGSYLKSEYRASISPFMAIARDWSLAGKSIKWFLLAYVAIYFGIIGLLEWGLFSLGIRKFRKSLRQEIETETLDD